MRLWSEDFQHEGMIPRLFSCDGDDLSPQLSWDEVPEDTASFAIIVDDPDAPMGTWVHWLLCDVPTHIRGLARGTVPDGARQVTNDFGREEYGGPCPPGGTHRYFFKLYALRVEVLPTITASNFYQLVEQNKIDEAVLMGTYSRR